jgi:FRG domain
VLPEDFFSPWERTATGWDQCLDEIGSVLARATTKRELVWRGVADSGYALHSSVYRRFVGSRGHPPGEEDVVAFELQVLRAARRRWRFDNLSALEILAHIQHYGGPTRLLDVSFNPLVALWFAVEQKFTDRGVPFPDVDGRLFIFDATDRQIDMDARWGGRQLPWESSPTDTWRTGLPRIWRPPNFNDRIPAQNSAFLIGGVPRVGPGDNAKYRKAPGDGTSAGTWTIDEVRAATSVTLSMNTLDRRPHTNSKPTFTLRIAAAGKPAVRAALETHFGFNVSSIYPDLYGLARYAADGISM